MADNFIVPVDTELFHGNQVIHAQHLNASVRAIADRQIVKPNSVGQDVNALDHPLQVQLISVGNDTLEVIGYDGIKTFGDSFDILKIWVNRISSLPTQYPQFTYTIVDTSTVTAHDPNNVLADETWTITPDYTIGAVLECENKIRGMDEDQSYIERASGRTWGVQT